MDAKSAADAVDGPPTKKLRAELSSNSGTDRRKREKV